MAWILCDSTAFLFVVTISLCLSCCWVSCVYLLTLCSCYDNCQQGVCSGPPAYECRCDIGWTAVDCSVDCGCNNHSTCDRGVHRCDRCLHRTTGSACEMCQPGSYGSATSAAVGQSHSRRTTKTNSKFRPRGADWCRHYLQLLEAFLSVLAVAHCDLLNCGI